MKAPAFLHVFGKTCPFAPDIEGHDWYLIPVAGITRIIKDEGGTANIYLRRDSEGQTVIFSDMDFEEMVAGLGDWCSGLTHDRARSSASQFQAKHSRLRARGGRSG